MIREILTHPPQTMHLALVTRRDPSLPIPKLRGRGQATEIRVADLRFTQAEAAAFFREKLNIPVDEATAALLDNKTEGWATGLRLAGLYLSDRKDWKHRVRELHGSSGHIAEYLIAEVLSRLEPEMATFLVETSIPDRFCAPLCQAMHGSGIEGRNAVSGSEARRFIEWLTRANIFVIPLDDKGHWFRYHHLFREFLRELLRKQTNADTIAELHMKAADWFEENGLTEEAIRHALAAGNTGAAVRLVVDHRYELMNSEQFRRLHRWLELLPGEVVDSAPLLVSARAFIALNGAAGPEFSALAARAKDMSAELSTDSDQYKTLAGEVYALQGVLNIFAGPSADVFTAGRQALRLLPGQALLIRAVPLQK